LEKKLNFITASEYKITFCRYIYSVFLGPVLYTKLLHVSKNEEPKCEIYIPY